MHILKSWVIAFSMYSKIPMPQFAWEEKDMRYVMTFFPLIGPVIGLLEMIWLGIGFMLGFTPVFIAMGMTLIPLLVSGGIHMDGFMDTNDALHSYGDYEKKRAILKDPHAGAFAMMAIAIYLLLYGAAVCQSTEIMLRKLIVNSSNIKTALVGLLAYKPLISYCLGFWFSRIFSGISVVTFPSMKGKGTLANFADTANRRRVLVSLVGQMFLCGSMMTLLGGMIGAIMVFVTIAMFGIYYRCGRKNFGGINGDLAGWFVTWTELLISICFAVYTCISL